MTVYLLEAYLAGASEADLDDLAERLSEAALALRQEGLEVRYVRSTYVPEDETCFHYVEVRTAGEAERFAERAGLPFDRIVEAKNAAVAIGSDPKEGR